MICRGAILHRIAIARKATALTTTASAVIRHYGGVIRQQNTCATVIGRVFSFVCCMS